MCCGCWNEEGSPQIDNDKVRAGLVLVQKVYEYHAAGGRLHIALDDWNYDDDSLQWLQGYLLENEPDSKEQGIAEDECLRAFIDMTLDERGSVLGLDDGCWRLT